jgi:CRP-like cAMP-binding protein/CheY-like chemotaxis protein
MQRKILVIDGNPSTRRDTSFILKLGGYDVLEASEGKTGLETALQEIPDLILCDLIMPGLDGSGVLHVLGKNPETASIPFVLQCGKTSVTEFRECMNLGADDFLVKPFESTDLLKVVEVRLNRRDLFRGLIEPDGDTIEQYFRQERQLRELERLTETRIHRIMRKKEVIYMDGQSPSDIFFIRRGMVKTYKINKDGKELITGFHRPGSVIGHQSVLQNGPYNENAEVVSEAEIGFISKQDFLVTLYNNHEVSSKIIQLLASQLHEAENRLLGIAYDSVRQKVAQALIKVSITYSDGVKPIRIARRDLSGLIGTATESLNRTLADFKDEGLINIQPEGISILNSMKLERMR